MRFTAPAGSRVPSRVPRALAAANAALVRSEIASRSCSATAARMRQCRAVATYAVTLPRARMPPARLIIVDVAKPSEPLHRQQC